LIGLLGSLAWSAWLILIGLAWLGLAWLVLVDWLWIAVSCALLLRWLACLAHCALAWLVLWLVDRLWLVDWLWLAVSCALAAWCGLNASHVPPPALAFLHRFFLAFLLQAWVSDTKKTINTNTHPHCAASGVTRRFRAT
jgi:hypothetical protein